MKLIGSYRADPYRTYCVPRRMRKGLSVYPSKDVGLYLDYSVDFSRCLREGEHFVRGKVDVHGSGLEVCSVYVWGSFITAFIAGGVLNRTFYLTFTAQTNGGGELSQEMILPTHGRGQAERVEVKYLALRPGIKPPTNRPPFNAVRLNNRYLLDDNGFFIGIS